MRHTITTVVFFVITLIFSLGPNSYAVEGESIDPALAASVSNYWVITTYYWDDGWVEHASWDASFLGPNLKIWFDAWNWPPEYSSFSVDVDNVYGYGDIDLPQGLIDDFNDGVVNPIWELGGSCLPIESGGVLTIDVLDGPAWPGQVCVGGLSTRNFVVHNAFDVRIDFTLNPEFHSTPNTNFKLIMRDEIGYAAEFSIRNGQFLSVELGPPDSSYWILQKSTFTNLLQGKLRVTRSLAQRIDVAIDIQPNSCPNPANLKSKGVLPVAIVGTDKFDVSLVDPATILFEGVPPLRWSYGDVTTPFEGELVDQYSCAGAGPDGFTDLVLKFDAQEIFKVLGNIDAGQVGIITIQGNLKDEYGSIPIIGNDVGLVVGGKK